MLRFEIEKSPADFLEIIAENHKTLRKQKNITESELAKRSGVSLSSIKRFESTGQIPLESLLKLSQVLNHLDDFDKILNPIKNYEEIEKLFSDKTRR